MGGGFSSSKRLGFDEHPGLHRNYRNAAAFANGSGLDSPTEPVEADRSRFIFYFVTAPCHNEY